MTDWIYVRYSVYTIDIWTVVCVYLSSENWSRAVWELKKRSVRKRERFSQHHSDFPSFTNFKLIDNENSQKNGTSGHPVPNTSGAEAIVSDH